MVDNNGMGERDSAIPSIAEPVLSGDYGATALPDAPPPPPNSSKLPWFAALTGAFVLLLGGGFFALTAFGASGGAETPEEAVDALIAAANAEDFITVAELLEPDERRVLAEPIITDVVPELVRLGVLNDSADVGNVEGFEWEFTDVTYRVEALSQSNDMVHVYFTGGQAAAEFNSIEFPFGDDFRERFGDEIEDEPRVTEAIEDTGNPMVLVERDGRWYFSAMFTMAENARLEVGERLPALGEMPRTLGAESPEAAVESMMLAMVDMDLRGMIGHLDPGEMAVLYRYAPLFLADAEEEVAEWKQAMAEEGVVWEMSDFDFDVETDGDDATVVLRGFTFELTSIDVDLSFTFGRERIAGSLDLGDFGSGTLEATPSRWVIQGTVDGQTVDIEVVIDSDEKSISASGEAIGETFSFEADLDESGVCSSYSVRASDGTEESGCFEDAAGSNMSFVTEQYIGFFDSFGEEFGGFEIATRRTDGEWYVSPISTLLNQYINSLQELDKGEFDSMLDGWQAASVVGYGTGSVFEEFGVLGSEANGSFEVITPSTTVVEPPADSFFDEGDDGFVDVFPEAVADPVVTLDLAPGSSISTSGRIDMATYDVISIDLVSGEVLTVTVQAEPGSDLDTTVEVFGPDGSIGYNDDADFDAGVGPLDSQLEATIETDGTYTIEVRSFGDFGEGAYTMTVDRG